jgi:DNA-binding XRE family transcriptional regulator/tetratricopeptide (TPR) repeat protein
VDRSAGGDPGSGFGQLLAALRLRTGLTQEELAERAELSPRAVSGMERGQVRRPQRATVQRLVDALALAGPAADHFVAVARGHRVGEGTACATGSDGPVDGWVPPAQLPCDVRPFHGRDAESAVLTWLMRVKLGNSTGPGVCALTGPAGIGKTALAVHWAHQVTPHFPDGQLYVDLRGHGPLPPVDPAEALADVLRALGLDEATIAGSTAERAGQMRSLFAARRILLLLDDAGSIDQIRPLLPGTGTSFCLVTSQDLLPGLVIRDGAARVPLDLFALEEATELLSSLITGAVGHPPSDGTPPAGAAAQDRDALERIATRCARLPLALRVAAEQMAAHPELSPRDHAARFEQVRPLEVLHSGGDDRSTVRTVLNWSVDQLAPRAQDAFARLGTHPGREWDADAAAALMCCPAEEAPELLDELTRWHLVERVAPDRYRQHDLLRALAVERTGRLPSRRRASLAALSAHYRTAVEKALDLLHAGGRDPFDEAAESGSTPPECARALSWLRREQSNIIAVVLRDCDEGLHEHALALALALSRPLELNGAADDGLEVFRRAGASARALGDRRGEADALAALAHQYLCRPDADPEEAMTFFARSLSVARRLGDPRRISDGLRGLGDAATAAGHSVTARAFLTESLQVGERAGDTSALLTSVLHLALLDHRQGRLLEARARAVEALHGFREAKDLYHEMRTRQLLGDLRLADEDAEGALAEYRRAFWCARRLGHRAMLAKAVAGIEHASALGGSPPPAAPPDPLT